MLALEIFGLFLLIARAGVPLLWALLVTTASIIWLKGFDYPLETIFLSYISGVEPFMLIAVPLFIFAGELLSHGGIGKRIVNFTRTVLGFLPGGLGIVTVASCLMFGGVSGSTSSRSADNLIAGYDGGFWGVQVGYMTVTDNTALSTNTVASNGTSTVVGGVVTYTVAPTVATLKATFYDTKATLLMAKYKVGGVWIKGGYQHIEYTNPSNPTQDATLTSIYGQSVGAWSTTPLTIGGAAQTKKLDVMWLGGNYDVTAKFNVALGWFEIRQNDFSNGTATAADKSGNGKFGSIILDYHLSKPFDVYAGYMNSQYNEGLAAGYPLASNNIFGLGARYSF